MKISATTKSTFRPAYLALHASGELARRTEQAWNRLEDCDLCARYCHVNRCVTTAGAVCRTGERAVVHGYGPHHGEEISPATYLNVMDQYRPCYRAGQYPGLDRPTTHQEFRQAIDLAQRYRLCRLDHERRRRWR